MLCLTLHVAPAQESVTDSVRHAYENATDDSVRIINGIMLVRQLSRTDANEAVQFGTELNKDLQILIDNEQYSKEFLLDRKWSLLSYMATAYHIVGDVNNEVKLLLTVLGEAEKQGDLHRQRTTLMNIGVSFQRQGHKEEAISYYRHALEIARQENNIYGIAMACGNIGTLMNSIDPDSSMIYYHRSLDYMLMDEMTDQAGALGWMYNNIGSWYESRDQVDSAFHYYYKSLEMRESVDHRMGMCIIHSEIAGLLFEEGRTAEAMEHINESVRIMEEGNFGTYSNNIYYLRSRIRESLGDYKGALDDYQLYKYYADSMRNDNNTKELVQQTTRYEYNQQLFADSLEYAKKEAIKNVEIKRQRIAIGAVAGGLILVALLAVSIRRGKKRSDELLRNILPDEVAKELKEKGEAEAKLIDEVTVLFTDFKGFTALAEQLSPKELVADIHQAFTEFDRIIAKYNIEKIKTIGDAYMAAGGLPVPNKSHHTDVVQAALEIRDFITEGKRKKIEQGHPYFEIRIGVHTGPVVAGIVGVKKFSYDIWGDTVNLASRMESSGDIGKVNVSQYTYELLKDDARFRFEHRGKIQAKGKGEVDMYFVERSQMII
jgi:class 3 adenylate cyclase/Tfp pilus assembly protein PilF